MPFGITSIYELLDLARDRPGMYGIGGRSYRLLQAFLGGLGYAKLDAGDPPFWDFDCWATVRTGHFPTSKPWHWMRHAPDEDAYAAWFALLDEYRKCHVVELATLPGAVVRFREHWRAGNGKPPEPYVPRRRRRFGSAGSPSPRCSSLSRCFPTKEKSWSTGSSRRPRKQPMPRDGTGRLTPKCGRSAARRPGNPHGNGRAGRNGPV